MSTVTRDLNCGIGANRVVSLPGRISWFAPAALPSIVPATTWFLWNGCRILGRVSIRHRLTPRLEDFGGHIGYDVRPSDRGRGYGSLLLTVALAKTRALGLPRVLLTCSPTNTASVRMILSNVGQLVSESPAISANNRPTQRYWIDTTR